MVLLPIALSVFIPVAGPKPASIEGITFPDSPKKIFVPLRDVCRILEIPLGSAPDGRLQAGGIKIAKHGVGLPSGARLIPATSLREWKAKITWDEPNKRLLVSRKGHEFYVRVGRKRVIIEKSNQRLIALQGTRTVMRSHVSTGRIGYRTPDGNFASGRKLRFNSSSIYGNAPMPYSVQIKGDIYVHGDAVVPNLPASHGCIRLPLNGPAEFFYNWVEPGTPIKVTGAWKRPH